MTLTFLGEPKSTQHIYRAGSGKFWMTEEGKRLKRDYRYEALAQWSGAILKGNVTITARLYFKTKGKHDIDNFNKLWADALTGIVYEDDKQIVGLHLYKLYDKERPRIELTVH